MYFQLLLTLSERYCELAYGYEYVHLPNLMYHRRRMGRYKSILSIAFSKCKTSTNAHTSMHRNEIAAMLRDMHVYHMH